MPDLRTAQLDFRITSLASLTPTQLALARLHPDFDEEADALRVCRLFFHARERARQRHEASTNEPHEARPNDSAVEEEEDALALVPLDFPLQGNLEYLSERQLAAVVVLAHPDATELHVLKAERAWRKRREKAVAMGLVTSGRDDARQTATTSGQARAPRPEIKVKQEPDGSVQTHRPPIPARSTPSAAAPDPPAPTAPAAPPATRTRAPEPTVVAAPAPPAPRPRTPPPPLPPLPSLETRLPEPLAHEIYPLRLSQLPATQITSVKKVEDLFDPSLRPTAVILHRPLEKNDVERTAYVGWTDFERRIEAMQQVITKTIGRWRTHPEFIECSKPKWLWSDIVKPEDREALWAKWNEKERERFREEAQMARHEEEMKKASERPGGAVPDPDDDGSEPMEMDSPAPATTTTTAANERDWTPPLPPPPPSKPPPAPVLAAEASEPEAIVLDSPVLPPLEPRPVAFALLPRPAVSRPAQELRSSPPLEVLPPARPAQPAPSKETARPRSQNAPPGPANPNSRPRQQPVPAARPTRPTPTGPASSQPNSNRPPASLPPRPRVPPPTVPTPTSSSTSSPAPVPAPPPARPPAPQQTTAGSRGPPVSVAEPVSTASPTYPIPTELVVFHPRPARSRENAALPPSSAARAPGPPPTSAPLQPPPSSAPAVPSLLARTTELEVRGSAPSISSSASHAAPPPLLSRLASNEGFAPSSSTGKPRPTPSPRNSPGVGRGHKDNSPGVSRGANGANGNARGRSKTRGGPRGTTPSNRGSGPTVTHPLPAPPASSQAGHGTGSGPTRGQAVHKANKKRPIPDAGHDSSTSGPVSFADRIGAQVDTTSRNGYGQASGSGGGGGVPLAKRLKGGGAEGPSLLSRLDG
ncbi:hypothetical protein JCM10212_000112 [Sporobolomyces blumeae]